MEGNEAGSWRAANVLLSHKRKRDVSEHKSPHADILQETNPNHGSDHRGSTIGEKGQRNSDNREQADHHSHVDNDVPEKHGGDTHGKQTTKTVIATTGNVKAP